MSPVPTDPEPEFVPLTTAARKASMTAYAIKTGVIAGLIRVVAVPGYPPKYNLSDAVQVGTQLCLGRP